MAERIEVVHNRAARRFETTIEGHLSVCDYVLQDGQMVFTHTGVPAELRGRGIAEQLVRAALAEARAKRAEVVPACSYVSAFFERHREFQDLLAR